MRERVFAAASAADDELWGGILKGKAVNLRCAEYHTVTPPGNLAFERHYDHGSLITIDIMLSDATAFDGGAFATSEPGDYLLQHPFEKGDLLLWSEPQVPLRLTRRRGTGVRNVFVPSLWEGDEREPADGRCDERHGARARPTHERARADRRVEFNGPSSGLLGSPRRVQPQRARASPAAT